MAYQFDSQALERFRPYLRLLANAHLGPAHQAKIDASDLVQQTMLAAFTARMQFRGQSDAELAGWLRQILKHNLSDALRDLRRAKRDIAHEQPLESVDDSFARAHDWLAAMQSSPSQRAVKAEELLRMAEALAQLPQAQRDAIAMHHLQGRPLAEVAAALDRSTAAVAGLLHRGLKTMRRILET
jgi:RNA polymerase sigma-70 factor (ECF subfamily)